MFSYLFHQVRDSSSSAITTKGLQEEVENMDIMESMPMITTLKKSRVHVIFFHMETTM